MALNIKNSEVERLVEEVSRMTGESKTEAVCKALSERKERLAYRVPGQNRGESFLRYLEEEIWPGIPKDELGKPLSKREKEEILGYGSEGV